MLKVGGPCLAYAVAKARHIPSISTIHSRLHLPQLLPSIGFPTLSDLLTTIHSFYGPGTTQPDRSRQTGLSMMIDKIAVEPHARYSSEQDAVVGICHEHAHLADLHSMSSRSEPVESLLKTKSLLDSGQCHRASEATMLAIARFGHQNYNPTVILASGTCKTEKAPDQLRLIKLVLDCWSESPHGEASNGQIWSICTDGDSRR